MAARHLVMDVMFQLLYIIFNKSDASIKHEIVETDSSGEYKIALGVFGISSHKNILAIYSNTSTMTGNLVNQMNVPIYIIPAIYSGSYGKIADAVNRYIVIQVYKINDNGQLIKPSDKISIKIYYYISE